MINVLVVDDSIVFRTQITASLNGVEGINVVGTAANGKIALQRLEQTKVDLVVLDMEMPEMNGIETIKQIKKKGFNVKIIVFSSQTIKGAENAFEALREGATDIVTKPVGDHLSFENVQLIIREALIPRILQFLNSGKLVNKDFLKAASPCNFDFEKKLNTSGSPINNGRIKKTLDCFNPQAIVIASSTGGPSALEKIFTGIKGPFTIPIFIVQHMPPIFTQTLAKRISEIIGSEVREAKNDELVQDKIVYFAPGGYHLFVDKNAQKEIRVILNQMPQRNSVRPAADFLFESASDVYGSSLLGIVLTGMGADGAEGAKKIKDQSGGIIIQNKESCVVFGMPGAVFENGDYDEIRNLEEINKILKKAAV